MSNHVHPDLLSKLDKTDEQLRRHFTCQRLEVELEVRLLPAHLAAAARAAASQEWGDRELRTQVDEQALSLIVLRHQVAQAVCYDGAPIGLDVVNRLDEHTLRRWGGHVAALEDEVDPPLESMTDEQLDVFVEGLKKKDPDCVASLTISDGVTLRGFVLYMAALLAKSATSTCSDVLSETS